jgi:nicotinamide mononucleotide adenylyltransferase
MRQDRKRKARDEFTKSVRQKIVEKQTVTNAQDILRLKSAKNIIRNALIANIVDAFREKYTKEKLVDIISSAIVAKGNNQRLFFRHEMTLDKIRPMHTHDISCTPNEYRKLVKDALREIAGAPRYHPAKLELQHRLWDDVCDDEAIMYMALLGPTTRTSTKYILDTEISCAHFVPETED